MAKRNRIAKTMLVRPKPAYQLPFKRVGRPSVRAKEQGYCDTPVYATCGNCAHLVTVNFEPYRRPVGLDADLDYLAPSEKGSYCGIGKFLVRWSGSCNIHKFRGV